MVAVERDEPVDLPESLRWWSCDESRAAALMRPGRDEEGQTPDRTGRRLGEGDVWTGGAFGEELEG